FRPIVVNSNDGTVITGRPGWVISYMCPSVPPLERERFAWACIHCGRLGASLASVIFSISAGPKEHITLGLDINAWQIAAADPRCHARSSRPAGETGNASVARVARELTAIIAHRGACQLLCVSDNGTDLSDSV